MPSSCGLVAHQTLVAAPCSAVFMFFAGSMIGFPSSSTEETSFKKFVRIFSLEKGKRSRPFLPKTCLNLQIAGCMPRERVQLKMTMAFRKRTERCQEDLFIKVR